jgi:hypothetical protein
MVLLSSFKWGVLHHEIPHEAFTPFQLVSIVTGYGLDGPGSIPGIQI